MYVYLNFFADSFQLGLSIREYLSLFCCTCVIYAVVELHKGNNCNEPRMIHLQKGWKTSWIYTWVIEFPIWMPARLFDLSSVFFHPARKHGKILNRATLWFTNKWGMSTLKHLNLTKKDQKRTSLGLGLLKDKMNMNWS